MNSWIFQGNPDIFDMDTYLRKYDNILWSVRQKHLAKNMQPGDEVFIWRASGEKGSAAGVVARGVLTGTPKNTADDVASKGLWLKDKSKGVELRIPIRIQEKCLGPKEVVRREWLLEDPVASGMRILKFQSETNYRISPKEALRLANLVRNTGRDWSREESIAGLWAYAHTKGKAVSKKAGSPVVEVAFAIGRAVTGVYNKAMNFRSIDPLDKRKGLSAGGRVDKEVWEEFFDSNEGRIQIGALDTAYSQLWENASAQSKRKVTYKDFGDAPNDDPDELEQFAARVRRGQPAFRRNLLAAYGGKCAISGHGPEEVLEAVHIVPHAGSGINALDNGLLMRGDLHSLIDARLLEIDPATLTIAVDSSLMGTPYCKLNGITLRKREDGSQIGTKYLKQRREARN
jgi:hypothetical protein